MPYKMHDPQEDRVQRIIDSLRADGQHESAETLARFLTDYRCCRSSYLDLMEKLHFCLHALNSAQAALYLAFPDGAREEVPLRAPMFREETL